MHFFHRCTSFYMASEKKMFLAEQRATHVPLPSVLGPRWIDGPLTPSWVDQTDDSLKGRDRDCTACKPIPQSWVPGGFQLCWQQYADGHCHATTQCVSTVVLGVCFEFQASACQKASHCNEYCLLLNPFPDNDPVLGLVSPKKTASINFPAVGWLLTFFLIGDCGCSHSMLCHLHSGS